MVYQSGEGSVSATGERRLRPALVLTVHDFVFLVGMSCQEPANFRQLVFRNKFIGQRNGGGRDSETRGKKGKWVAVQECRG